MKSFFLIGKNIQTSLSPLLHNVLFQLKGKQGWYYSLYRKQNTVPSLNEPDEDNKIAGLSITIPFKKYFHQQELPNNQKHHQSNNKISKPIQIQYRGQFAKQTKIINTLVRDNNDKYIGYNTDIFGVGKCLEKAGNIGNVLVLGAGATGCTFVHYLQSSNSCQNILLQNRSLKPVQQLRQKYPKVIPITSPTQKTLKIPINLIINTLPTQIIKQNHQSYSQLINQYKLTQRYTIMDVNYRTKLHKLKQYLSLSLGRGINQKEDNIGYVDGCTGLDMLIWQAIQQNRLFCGEEEESKEKQDRYYRILRQLVISVPCLIN